MAHYKMQPRKSETCYRLIPTLMFIIAITSIILTMFFMFVLQSRNAYALDSDEHFNVENDDFKMEITGATSEQIAKLDLDNISLGDSREDNISLEDNTNILTTSQPPPYETFVVKKTINPSTNDPIKTTNLPNIKAYKIVSKEPIIGNSLVKIVMAPQNVLEKLSKQDDSNLKYAHDKINKSGNVPIKNYSVDDAFDRELNRNGNVRVDVFSVEEDEEGNVDFMETTQQNKNVLHHESNNIQVIANSHKQPINMMDRKKPFELNVLKESANNANNTRDEFEEVNHLQTIDVEMKPQEIVTKIDLNETKVPISTTEAVVVDSSYNEAEELLSNPTTSTAEGIKSKISEEREVSTETNNRSQPTSLEDNSQPISLEDLENSQMSSVELTTEANLPLVVLKILKNRTVVVEETTSQSAPDQLSVETTIIPKLLSPITRPKKITAIKTPIVATKQYPKKAILLDPVSKYKNAVPKFDKIPPQMTPKTNLLDIETTHQPPDSTTPVKSKNIKRAVGDEGTFSNIVRPIPITPINLADLFPNETEPERQERLSKSMQRLMHFVTVVGQVDSYLTKRFRHGLKNVARIFDSVEDTRRRRSFF